MKWPKVPAPPRLTAKHVEERLKFMTAGLQNLALLLFGAVLLQPLINSSLSPAGWLKVAAVFTSGLAELCAIALLRYIPFTPDPTDRQP